MRSDDWIAKAHQALLKAMPRATPGIYNYDDPTEMKSAADLDKVEGLTLAKAFIEQALAELGREQDRRARDNEPERSLNP